MRSLVLGGMIWGSAAAAVWAQPDPLPDFATCMDMTVARYEQDLRRLRARPEEARDFDIGDVRGVDFCGTVGIVRCDRSEDPLPCQRRLSAEQDALKRPGSDAVARPGYGAGRGLCPCVVSAGLGAGAGPLRGARLCRTGTGDAGLV